MKRILAVFATLLIPAAVAAATLPDNYRTKGQLDGPYICDNGKTTVKHYLHEDWDVIDIFTASGDLYVNMESADGLFLFVERPGTKMTEITHDEFDSALQEKAPAVFGVLHGDPSDCRHAN